MEFDYSMLYGPVLILLVPILGFIINNTKERTKDYERFKGKYTTFYHNLLYALSAFGGSATILGLGFFQKYLNYRVSWVYNEVSEAYAFTTVSTKGPIYNIIDLGFVLYVFIVLYVFYKRTIYREDNYGRGFLLEGKSSLDFIISVPFILAPFYSGPAFIAFICGVSFALIILTFIIIVGTILYMFHVYEKKILTPRMI